MRDPNLSGKNTCSKYVMIHPKFNASPLKYGSVTADVNDFKKGILNSEKVTITIIIRGDNTLKVIPLKSISFHSATFLMFRI